jgi:hypothetical protein
MLYIFNAYFSYFDIEFAADVSILFCVVPVSRSTTCLIPWSCSRILAIIWSLYNELTLMLKQFKVAFANLNMKIVEKTAL